jgi:drug/metabolite transporter (DMT)-like permease
MMTSVTVGPRTTDTPSRADASPAAAVGAVLLAFVGLSLGSTMAKASGAPGAVVAFWRFLIGACLWHVVVAVRGARSATARTVDGEAWRAALLPGVAFGVNLSCFFSGATRTPIAHAEFISALTPLVLIPLAAVMLRERVPRAVLVCGAVALCGVMLVLSRAPSKGASSAGDLLVLGSMGAWIVYLLSSKSARARVGTVEFMAAMSTIACATTLPVALITAGSPAALIGLPATAWLLVAALAVTAGMVSHGLIIWAQPRVAVGTISMLQLGQPVLGVVWAAVFLGETVAPVQLLGVAIVLAALGTIARRSRAR